MGVSVADTLLLIVGSADGVAVTAAVDEEDEEEVMDVVPLALGDADPVADAEDVAELVAEEVADEVAELVGVAVWLDVGVNVGVGVAVDVSDGVCVPVSLAVLVHVPVVLQSTCDQLGGAVDTARPPVASERRSIPSATGAHLAVMEPVAVGLQLALSVCVDVDDAEAPGDRVDVAVDVTEAVLLGVPLQRQE